MRLLRLHIVSGPQFATQTKTMRWFPSLNRFEFVNVFAGPSPIKSMIELQGVSYGLLSGGQQRGEKWMNSVLKLVHLVEGRTGVQCSEYGIDIAAIKNEFEIDSKLESRSGWYRGSQKTTPLQCQCDVSSAAGRLCDAGKRNGSMIDASL